jgi:hypothetical protein
VKRCSPCSTCARSAPVQEFEGLFGVHHFQTKEIGRRHRYCGVAGGFRGAGIRVGRIALAERLAEEPQPPGFDMCGNRRKAAPDNGMIDHVRPQARS